MPTLDWLNRDEAMRIADAVPYRLLDHVGTHGASHPRVKHWVRNLERDAAGAFWLLTSHGRFFPDFICEMMDGRILVIEYKGEHLRQMQSEIGKDQVGKL